MALPRSLTQQRRELTKFWLQWRWWALSALGAVILLLGVNKASQWYADHSAEEETQSIQRGARRVTREIWKGLTAEVESFESSIDFETLAELVKSNDAKAIQRQADALTLIDEGVLRARLVKPELDEPDYDNMPPLTFASLEMMQRATQEEVGPEVHLFGAEGQHIAWLRKLETADQELTGYLFWALDVSLLNKALAETKPRRAYIELVQRNSKKKRLILGSSGQARLRAGLPVATNDVGNGTSWEVSYWSQLAKKQASEEPRGLSGMTIAAIVGLIALVGAIVVTVKNRRTDERAKEEQKRSTSRRTSLNEGTVAASVEPEPEPANPELESPPRPENGIEVVEHDEMPSDDELTPPPFPPSAPPSNNDDSHPSVPASIFREYDIRGVVGESLTEDYVRLIGKALGSEAYERGQQTLVVACDGRHSGPDLLAALVEGLRSTGRDVIDIGRLPTPLLYFATHYLNTGSGVMVTGSHNPPEYNGLKIMLGGDTLHGDDIAGLRERIESGNFVDGNGSMQSMEVLDEYIRRVTEEIPVALGNAFRVVVDCGNGIAGLVAPKLIRALGHDVIELYCDVDGDFPNHHPDPSEPENLKDLITAVKEHEADMGFAFDGDGDRLGIVDPQGNIIWPDRQMMLFAVDVLRRHPGAEIVFDVKCSSRLGKVIKAKGGKPVMYKTGHSLMKAKLRETGAPLAGEMSGHIFFNDHWYGFDDGAYAAARMLELMMNIKQSPGTVFSKLPTGVNTPELRLNLEEGRHHELMAKLVSSDAFADGTISTVDGVRVDYSDSWGLVRASNTTPSLVLRFEGDDQVALERIQAEFRTVLLSLDETLELPF